MSTVRKFNKANAAITGFEIHNGFIGEETLLHIAQDNSFQQILEKFCNEKMRAYRDFYREYESKSLKYIDKKSHQEKVQSLYDQWFEKTINYFGYSDFKHDSIEFEDNGKAYVLLPEDESHSVAVFLCNDLNCPLSAFERGATLTNIEGETLFEDKVSHSWSLAEQVEKSMQKAGISEAVLFLPFRVYYFRSDSQLSEQCLEINFSDLMKADQDQALALATHIISESFFRYQADASPISEDEDSDSEDTDEEESTSSGDVRLTPSSNLFKEDLELARQITEELHKQVTLALEILANERLAVDAELTKDSKKKNSNEKVSHQLFENGLFVLYRVLFVLYAEAKKFLPVDNRQYASFYSIDHLLEWSSNYLKNEKKGIADPEGTYLWGALKALFTLLRRGIELNGKELVSPYNGQLFSPDQAEIYDNGPLLRDAAIARVLISLSKVGGDESGRKWNFENLGIEQLGAVYEAMLTQKPMILLENHEWVPAHGGGVGLVATSFADAMDLERIELDDSSAKTKRKAKGKKKKSNINLDDYISRHRPGHNPTKGKFVLSTMGGKRRQTASFYTPPKLAQFLVKRTLRPLVENKSVEEILKVKVIEPAVGSGGFLIASVRYMADELLRAKHRENHIDIRGKSKIEFSDLQRCKRQICEKCLFGVDINPLSVELTRTSLYLECLIEGEPLPFLHHHLKSGNTLIWADFQLNSTTTWVNGSNFHIPSLFDIPVDNLKIDKKILEAWDVKQENLGKDKNSKLISKDLKDKVSDLKSDRKSIGDNNWHHFVSSLKTSLTTLIKNVSSSQEDFEKVQNNPNIVDQLDERHKDKLSMIPDMDNVLIEGYGIIVDPVLEKRRKRALINEYGVKQYNSLVKNQRSYMRMKALGDLNTSLWFWPIDRIKDFPSYSTYKELLTWLLNTETLDRSKKSTRLSTQSLKVLNIALRVAKQHCFFHWQIEFANIFQEHHGFSAYITNPPWKIIEHKDVEFYSQFDPMFKKNKSQKGYISKLNSINNQISIGNFNEYDFSLKFSDFWKNHKKENNSMSGKFELCIGFSLLPHSLLKPSGKYGVLVSKSSVFANKGAMKLREGFFSQFGLRESCSFTNKNYIFDILQKIEFTTLVGEKPKSINTEYFPIFVSNVTNLSDLVAVENNIDKLTLSSKSPTTGPLPVRLTLDQIKKYFSKDNISIPALTDQRQIDLAENLYEVTGSKLQLDQIEGVYFKKGVNQSTGPKQGISANVNDLSNKDIPSQNTVFSKNSHKWLPLYRGRQFNILTPITDESANFEFNQYVKRENIKAPFSSEKPTLLWRDISCSHTNRKLIASVVPSGTWGDDTTWTLQCDNDEKTYIICALMSSFVCDFFTRLIGNNHVNKGIITSIPIPSYNSGYLKRAVQIVKERYAHTLPNRDISKTKPNLLNKNAAEEDSQAEIDALIWLHYGFNNKKLSIKVLTWMVESQFKNFHKASPNYLSKVISFVNKHKDNATLSKTDEGLFISKDLSDEAA